MQLQAKGHRTAPPQKEAGSRLGSGLLGRRYKAAQMGVAGTTNVTPSQFWRPEAHQGVGRVGSSGGLSPQHAEACLLAVLTWSSLCACVS